MASTSNDEPDRDEATDAEAAAEDDAAHLADLPDGSGCAEVWEYTTEERAAGDEAEDGGDTEDGGDREDGGAADDDGRE